MSLALRVLFLLTPCVFAAMMSVDVSTRAATLSWRPTRHGQRTLPLRTPSGYRGGRLAQTAAPPVPLCGAQPESFYLHFPLGGATAYSRIINSVMDHSMSSPYTENDIVTAFTGEIGEAPYSEHLDGFQNSQGIDFLGDGAYRGAGGLAEFLYYDGHPGIDYQAGCTSSGSANVYAAASGTVHYPASIPGIQNAATFNVLQITPDPPNDNYRIYYLHLSTYKGVTTTQACEKEPQVVPEGAHVIGGASVIGRVGKAGTPAAHLHFEVHVRQANGTFVPVDPYGWQGQYADPRGIGSNTNLWKPQAYADCSARWHPDGTLISPDGGSVYIIEGGQRRGIPSMDVFYAYGYDFKDVVNISAEELSCFREGSALGPPPSPRLRTEGATTYEITDRGFRRGFPSAKVFQGQGFRWTDVSAGGAFGIPGDPNVPVYFSPFRDGSLVQEQGSPVVYVISNSRKRPFGSSSAFLALGYRFDDVIVIDSATASSIPTGETITDALVATCGTPAANTRVISVAGDMAFGSVAVGTTATKSLTIGNTGSAPLTVTGITHSPGFSGSWTGTIAAGASQAVPITFAPIANSNYVGTITVHSDATGGTASVTVSGSGTSGPAAFGKSIPANGELMLPLNVIHTWQSSAGAAHYEFCYDRSDNNVCDSTWVNRATARDAASTGLIPDTTYYWQVRAVNAAGTTYANGGAWWSFRTTAVAPGEFLKTAPFTGELALPTNPTLRWGASSGAATYEYCLDAADNNACDAAWLSVGGLSVVLNGLSVGTTYYWQVRAVNPAGTTYANAGAWWTFTTLPPPAAFTKLGPASGAANQPLAITMSWAASPRATDYEYCVDALDNTLCDATWIPVSTTVASVVGLSPNTRYWWQVRARGAAGTTAANDGAWWDFRTRLAPGIYFENDLEDAGPGWGMESPWTITSERAHSGSMAWTDSAGRAYGANLNASITSPAIDLRSATAPRLRFWQYRSLATDAVDEANVWVTLDNGTTFTHLRKYVGADAVWRESVLDLTPYAGQASLRVVFQMLSNETLFGDGWYIDDIIVDESNLPGPFGKGGPPNGAVGQLLSPTLTWGESVDAITYEYCVDGTNDDACDGPWRSVAGRSAQVPELLPNTTYWWQVRARSGLGTREANNGTWWSFATPVHLPDLSMEEVSDPPVTSAPGSSFSPTDWVENVGLAPSSAFTIRYYFSRDRTFDSGDRQLTGGRIVTALSALGSSTGSTTVVVPAGTPDGAYFLIACADGDRAVSEGREDNNCRASMQAGEVRSGQTRARALRLWWQHQDSGHLVLWNLNGTALSSGAALSPAQVADTTWKIVGTEDFNGDGHADFLWQNQVTRLMTVWLMNGNSFMGPGLLSHNSTSDRHWAIRLVTDLNGDSKPDIVWQHETEGWVAVWLMNGLNLMEARLLTPGRVGLEWRMVGAADFNADGRSDLVWQNQRTGLMTVWLMNGPVLVAAGLLSTDTVADTNWKIRAVVDINGDGFADFVWHHQTTGLVVAWLMRGTAFEAGAVLGPGVVSPRWQIVGGR